MDQMPTTRDAPALPDRPLIVFDGECVLCSTNAQFVMRHDHCRRFALTTAQGVIGQAIYRRLGLSTTDFATMVLVEHGEAVVESEAALRIAAGLGWPWRAAGAFRLVPRGLRDALYRFVARHRFRLFGRRESCWRPGPDVMDRIV